MNELIDVSAIEKFAQDANLEKIANQASDIIKVGDNPPHSNAVNLDDAEIDRIAHKASDILAGDSDPLVTVIDVTPVANTANIAIVTTPNADVVIATNTAIRYGATADKIEYKYAEDRIITDFQTYIDSTYSQYYMSNDKKIECFDAWIAMGDVTPTFRNTAMKYLWRYGKKKTPAESKDDLFKALHYVLMCLYNDHYKGK